MLIRMKVAMDLFYVGEILSVPEFHAQDWVARGYAELADCPECGALLQESCCRVYCENCGFKRNIHW
jgi:hypothetical protein